MESNYYLVDIGNTHFHIYKDGKIMHLKEPIKLKRSYYISVNEKKEKEFLALNRDAINLEPFIKLKSSYKNLGIDRKVLALSIDDGVVVDAGSAITIDVIENGVHLGGVIMPGLYMIKKSLREISKRLDVDFSNLTELPQNTSEAITAGSIGAIKCIVEKFNKKIYLTGGDGRFLNRFIDGEYKEGLIFIGMKKIIKGIK